VAAVVYVDILEEFFVATFGEEGPHDMQYQRDGEPSRLYTGTCRIETFEKNGLAEAALSRGHLVPLTLRCLNPSGGA